ncbi:MAG: ATP-binding protein [Microbacteriaceae bacterium]|nr:MAG: ATP-binding protein [Microbacteriaceae bacterium]
MTVGPIDVALASGSDALAGRLLELPESQWFDRKSARIEPRKLAETIVAFANADGGTIVVGLSGGKVEGVDSDPKRLNALMQANVDFTDPTVPTQSRLYECVRADGGSDHLLVIEVPPGRTVYATNRDEAYLRLGDESRKLSFAQRRELFYDKSQSSFESELTKLRVNDVDRALLDSYVMALGAGGGSAPRSP